MKMKDKVGCDSHPSSSLFIFLLCLFSTPDFHNENCWRKEVRVAGGGAPDAYAGPPKTTW